MGTSSQTGSVQQNNNSTTTPVLPAATSAALGNLTTQIGALGNVPATSYVAPQNALQTQANAQGAATLTGTNPNYTTAGTTIGNNSSITPGSINGFLSPYLGQVLNTTNQQLDQGAGVQDANLEAQGAANGAFGGSRFGVAQGVLGGQQQLAKATADANIENTGYSNAVTTALNNAGLGQTAGVNETNLGTSENASNIANTAELANLGGAAQATSQAQAAAPLTLASIMASLYGSTVPLTAGSNTTGNLTQNSQQTSTASPLQDLTSLGGLFSGGSNSASAGVANLIAAL